ncbi:MAG: hydantoinase/oxoprolinase family protein, partial [Planctomycetota bacterium]
DVAVVQGEPRITKEGTIGGFPLRIPTIEIHTVGAGGGSIARVDAGGALQVGPESAGAEPGPACYGAGGRRATVTDANVLLGRIDAAKFFGGRMKLDVAAARRAVGRIAKKLGCTLRKAAAGIVAVANANMERAIRRITVERGIDPSDFWLVAFGGAGPMHACALAEALRMKGVLVPPWPGLFSALGMVYADRIEERWRTVLTRRIQPRPGRLFDMRYVGQPYEIRCRTVAEFHRLHRERYGFARRGEPVEAVNVGTRKVTPVRKPKLRGGRKSARLRGPAVFTENDATTYVPKGWKAATRKDGSLRITRTQP